jgi:hypothetical protein
MRASLFAALSVAALTVGTACAADPNQLTVAERAAGWRLLFDGRTTAGWVEVTGKPFPTNSWAIDNGSLKSIPRKDGQQDIRTVDTFREFELEFDWQLHSDGNSGVKYLVQKIDVWTNKEGRQARARGLEYQLAGDHEPDSGSDVTRAAGSLYSVIAPLPRVPPRIDRFNHSRIVVRSGVIEHWMNGTRVVRTGIAAPVVQKQLRALRGPQGELLEEGPISLQNHGSDVWIRNIKIRPLT